MNVKTPEPVDVQVGSRVRLRRKILGLSQEKLGKELGLTFQQVQKYEKGSNRIGASRLQQIAHILQVPAAYFFENENNKSAAGKRSESESVPEYKYVSDFLGTAEGIALIKAFVRIKNDVVRRRIIALIESLVEDYVDHKK